jgi:hypothetical protein
MRKEQERVIRRLSKKRLEEITDDYQHGFVPQTETEREMHAVILELLAALAKRKAK